MAKFSAQYSGKPAWYLDLEVNEGETDAVNNRSYVGWELWIYRGNGDTPFNNQGSSYGVGAPGGFDGTFPAFDYSSIPVGGRYRIASGGGIVNRNPDGTPSGGGISVYGFHNSGTTLGDANTGSQFVPLSTLKRAPTSVTNVAATRTSDTQIKLNWQNNAPSNGAPTGNDINVKINNSAFGNGVSVNATTSGTFTAKANQKLEYQVRAYNSAGYTAFSATSAPVYTTPGAPTDAKAVKGSNLDTVVTFTSTVAYSEHEHEVWHGTVAGGVTTWDSTPLTTLASGVTSYTHSAPDASKVHIYRVRAKAGSLYSAYSTTEAVQLLVAPNKPTVPSTNPYAVRTAAFTFAWNHNSVDTTPQSSYEFQYSTDGGSTWSGSGKVASSVSQRVIAANTFTANQAVAMRVRTWGSATTGGSEGTGASPWSDTVTVTFKSLPNATITSPANNSTVNDSTVRATLGFSQAEGATFVSAQVELYQGGTLIETLDSSQLTGITLQTQVQNGTTYLLRARVRDSNGLWSNWASTNFSVTYLAPAAPVVTTTFLIDSGFGQLDITLPAPGGGQSATATVSITRIINGVEEIVVSNYPSASSLTFLDTTPVTNGTNTYRVTATSALGAQATTVKTLVTTELRRAYLSKGASYEQSVVFGGNLRVDESLSVASDVITAAGRIKPIGLYGVETNVQLKVSGLVYAGFGSSVDAIRTIFLRPGKACYRDPSGRRIFGTVKGGLKIKPNYQADLDFSLTETS